MPINPDAKWIATHFAARLTALRKARGLTQAQLAPAMDVKHGQISKYENGESLITLDNLYKAANFFGVDVDDLLPRALPDAAQDTARGVAEAPARFDHEATAPLAEADALTTAFLSISDAKVRAAILAHTRALAE